MFSADSELRGKILTGVLLAVVAAAVIVFAFWPRPDVAAPTTDDGSIASATISPNAPEVTEEVDSDAAADDADETAEVIAPENANGPGEDIIYGEFGSSVDLAAHYAASNAGVLAYMTVTPGESAEARAARLSPYFEAGSPYLTVLPKMANPRGYEGMEATVEGKSTPLSAYVSDTGDIQTIQVVIRYRALHNLSGSPMESLGIGVWNVTMNTVYDGQMLSVQEPVIG